MEIVKSCVKPPVETMAQLALAYNLSYPGISCIIPGAKNPDQVQKNVSAAGIRLSEEVMEKLGSIKGFVF